MEVQSIRINGLLSFGASFDQVELGRLNVFIGPNGSGKSNLFDIFDLLRNLPRDVSACIRRGGGIHEWIWKGAPSESGIVELVLKSPRQSMPLRYLLAIAEAGGRLEIVDERIENLEPFAGKTKPYLYYGFENGRPIVNVAGKERGLKRDQIDPGKSILEQRRDPESYPEITYLADSFERIRLFREWSVGRQNPLRQPQSTDAPSEFLEPDGSNLGLILNNLRKFPKSERVILEHLKEISNHFLGFHVEIVSSAVQIFIKEEDWLIPATRLSDGTLRYLSMLAILCHPNPPPFICIEEPEIGMHPDTLPGLARLLEQASERCQLLVTTHSDILIDALSHTPESIRVVEKHNGSTVIRSLAKDEISDVKNQGLGKLWTSGELGGTRW